MMSNTLIQKLTNIKTAKDNLKTAFEGMGLNPGNDFSSYANFAQEQLQPAGSGVKLFSTIAEMDADPNPHEGDLAIVYGQEINKWNEGTSSNSIQFIHDVVLDTIVSSTIRGRMNNENNNGVDISINIRNNEANFSIYTENGYYRIEYASEDGQHYTRTDSYDDTLIFDSNVIYDTDYYSWNDIFGEFMKSNIKTFNGLYEYKLNNRTTKFKFRDFSTNIHQIEDGAPTSFSVPNFLNKEYDLEKLKNIVSNSTTNYNIFYIDNNNKLKMLQSNNSYDRIGYETNDTFAGLVALVSAGSLENATIYTVNETTYELEDEEVVNASIFTSGTSIYNIIPITNIKSLPQSISSTTESITNMSTALLVRGNLKNSWCEYADVMVYSDMYSPATTQLNLLNSSQLLPNIIGYGKNGVVSGDNSIFTSLKAEYINDILKISNPESWFLKNANNVKGLNYIKNISFKNDGLRTDVLEKSIRHSIASSGSSCLIGYDENYYYGLTSNNFNTLRKINKQNYEYEDVSISYPETISVASNSGALKYINGNIYIVGLNSTKTKVILYEYNISNNILTKLDEYGVTASIDYQSIGYVYKKDNDLYYGIEMYKNRPRTGYIIGRKISNNIATTILDNTLLYESSNVHYSGGLFDEYQILPGQTEAIAPIIINITTGEITTHSTLNVNIADMLTTSHGLLPNKFGDYYILEIVHNGANNNSLTIVLFEPSTKRIFTHIINNVNYNYSTSTNYLVLNNNKLLIYYGDINYIYDYDNDIILTSFLTDQSIGTKNIADLIFTNNYIKYTNCMNTSYMYDVEIYPYEIINNIDNCDFIISKNINANNCYMLKKNI